MIATSDILHTWLTEYVLNRNVSMLTRKKNDMNNPKTPSVFAPKSEEDCYYYHQYMYNNEGDHHSAINGGYM